MTELEFLNDPFRGPIAEISSLLLKKSASAPRLGADQLPVGAGASCQGRPGIKQKRFWFSAITITNLDGNCKNKDREGKGSHSQKQVGREFGMGSQRLQVII